MSRYGVARRLFNAGPLLAALIWVWTAAPAAAEATADDGVRLLALGDSLTAGYGLPADKAFTTQLERALKARGLAIEVIDAGVSGDTSAGGKARLDWALADNPGYALVELGANDALRGIDPADTRANLDAIIGSLKARGVRVLLAGMLAPPNMGRAYGEEFNAIFPALAQKHDVPLYPFFLDGVAADPALNQDDGIHPNGAGVAIIVDRLAPYIERLVNGD
ncbi:arylesterase [Oceanibacterium hippocampi]|uniref:Acyl-CoA thioesterase I n=1 Tax=Oceanibacterium hippocampi TaxID=745714 RepID=A0A1Y5R9W1_9PROT|nr:arylesterase [Oceanibacterium hippocampi]SLN12176.1 Acyl-CoA thioesterase I precursor [Oceanibacterium hippocampi]